MSGRLLSETDPTGRATSYTYGTDGKLATVTSTHGRTLSLTYNGPHIASITDPANGTYSYTYDANNNLARVTYPDGSAKLYHYENAAFPHHLTGISYQEANGTTTRYGTYGYDTNGKAVSTEHAGGQERFTLTYNSDTQTTVTDAAGTQEILAFSSNLGVKNLVSKVNGSDGKGLAQTFDGSNNLTCKKDDEGKVVTYTYNATNQRLSQTEGLTGSCTAPQTTSATRTTNYNYVSATLDAPTLMTSPSVYGGSVKSTSLAYGDTRFPTLPTSITQGGYTPSGTVVTRTIGLAYHSSGQVASINGPRTDVADTTTLAYYTCTTGGGCGQLQSVTNALGHTTTYDGYDANGRVTQTTDANGLKTQYSYNPRGQVITITHTPAGGIGRVTGYSYNAAGNVTQVNYPDGRVLSYSYDAAQQLRTVTDNLGNRVAYGYDLKGNRTQEATYDPANTLVRQIDLAFDARNRIATLNTAGSLTQQLHDAVGNLTRVTDPNQSAATTPLSETHAYDALNRLIQTIDNLGGNTNYGYNNQDKLTQVAAPNGATTQYVYDDLGNLLQEISPDRGTTTYTYDSAGNVRTITDARGIVVNYSYDPLNRVTGIDYPTDTDTTFTYDAGANCTLGVGRLCQVIDESGTTQYGYDTFGNIVAHYKTELSRTYVTRYSYDLGDRLISITYPDNRIVAYTRDTAGRLTAVQATVNGTSTPIVSGGTYRADGLLLSRTYGNGLNDVRQYDLKGNLTYQSLGSADTRVYSYDPNGNVTQAQTLPQVGNYLYDPLDRLTRDQIVTNTTSNQSYVYDGNGNRTQKGPTVYGYGSGGNRLTQVGTTALTYDAAGNMLTNGSLRYAYSDGQRLRQAFNGTTLRGAYTYNHLGQRTRKVADGSTTVYHYGPQGELILETSNTAVTRAAYIYADATPLAQVRRSGTTDTLVYPHTDHEGTPRLATNAAAVKVWSWEGRAFGDTNPNQDPDGNGSKVVLNFRYPGQYFDAESGLFYNWNRYYDPKTGRYISSDPIGLAGGLNTYAYVLNNPLRYTDPSGLFIGSGLGKLLGRLLGRTPEEAAYGGKVLDVGIGAAAGTAPGCIGGVDVRTPASVLQGIGGAQAIGLSTATTFGLYGAGATIGAAGAAAIFPATLAGVGGAEVGSALNGLYEQARGNSFGSDLYDLINDGRLYDHPSPPKCGCQQ